MKFSHRVLLFFFGLIVATGTVWYLFNEARDVGDSPPGKEARALWFHRFEYTRVTRTHDQDSIRQYIGQIIDKAADANFNMVIFQVRGNGDAYYTPGLEPWGHLLTGTVGKDPGWDPLQFAIEKAHSRGIELHAWLNTFPAWRGTELPPETTPRAAILEHPEWIVADSAGNPMPMSDHYVSFSPGIPAVHDYIINVVTDIVSRYDVDGIHFDYIRYPEGSPHRGYSHDPISVQRFQSESDNPYNLSWEDWQREQLNQFVYKAYNAITEAKPWVKMSAAVIGSYNTSSWNAYHVVYQDPRRWTEMEKIDFIVPMSYFQIDHPTHQFDAITQQWYTHYTLDRPLFSGIGSYRFTSRNNLDWSEAVRQIEAVRRIGVPGMVFFDASSVEGHYQELAREEFRSPANIPPMTWKTDSVPPVPANFSVEIANETITMYWENPDTTATGIHDIRQYNVYASPTYPIKIERGVNLKAVLPTGTTEWTFPKNIKVKPNWFFGVTSLNRVGVESELSTVMWGDTPHRSEQNTTVTDSH